MDAATHYTLELPYPPSMNHYWRRRGGGGMMLSDQGRAYRDTATIAIRSHGVELGTARVRIVVGVLVPDRRIRDIDNLWKPLLDAIRHGGAYDDDEQIDCETMIRLGMDRKNPRVIVVLSPIPAGWDAMAEFRSLCR